MDQEADKRDLARAERLVQEARAIIERQRARAIQLKADGASTQLYERTLRAFDSSLHSLEQHVRLLRSHFGE